MPRARKRCGRRDCDEPLPCPVHKPQPWARSDRRAHLPSNWSSLSKTILERDPTCQLGYDCCTVTSTQVDHAGDRDDHSPHMLRGVCAPCHGRRTAEQSLQARRASK